MKFQFFMLFLPLLIYQPTLASPFSEQDNIPTYQEVTYDDLLKEINGQKKQVVKESSASPLDDVKIHMGLGMVSSITHFTLHSTSYERFQNGIALALGIDLFSESWFAESLFKNYGVTSKESENLALRELDLLLGYKRKLSSNLGYSIRSGLSNRYLNYSNLIHNINHEENSPSLLLSTGLNMEITPSISFDIEVSGQSALVQSTSLKNAVEFSMRINTSL